MLWLCIHLPLLPLEAFATDDNSPLVITVTEGRCRRIVACNQAAVRVGLSTATEFATALTLCPQLRAVERNAPVEHRALKRLAAWSYQWSDHVTARNSKPQDTSFAATLWLEIGASSSLFGGYPILIKRLEASLSELGYTYQLSAAPTLEGAALLARAGKRVLIFSKASLLANMAELSTQQLELSSEVVFALWRSGIRTVGDLIAIPTAAIARRFGPEVALYLNRLRGTASDPRRFYRPPKRYRAHCEFGFNVDSTEALLFPIRRLLYEFCGYLNAIDAAIQRFALWLEHRGVPSTFVEIGLATPGRNPKRLFALVQEKFHRLTLPQDVHGIRLHADTFCAPTDGQADLFDTDAENTELLLQVLEKISMRLGANAVHTLTTIADHRPEYVWRRIALNDNQSEAKAPYPRPLWLLSQPQLFDEKPAELGEPERIESGWWDSASIDRDYYTVTTDGSKLWVFRDRQNDQWYLHGFWA